MHTLSVVHYAYAVPTALSEWFLLTVRQSNFILDFTVGLKSGNFPETTYGERIPVLSFRVGTRRRDV